MYFKSTNSANVLYIRPLSLERCRYGVEIPKSNPTLALNKVQSLTKNFFTLVRVFITNLVLKLY